MFFFFHFPVFDGVSLEDYQYLEVSFSASVLILCWFGSPIHSVSCCLQLFIIIDFVFHWRLRDSKSPQVSRALLTILSIFSNAVVWMVSPRSTTSKSSCPFSNPLVSVPKAPITIGIIVTGMFHSFFNSLVRSMYISFFSHSFKFILWSAGRAKYHYYYYDYQCFTSY